MTVKDYNDDKEIETRYDDEFEARVIFALSKEANILLNERYPQ